MNTRILAIVATAGASLAATHGNSQDFAASVSTGFESDYVFRGIHLAEENMHASLDASYGDAYFGAWTLQSLGNQDDYNEVNVYAGYGIALDETYRLDFGATAYLYPEDDFADDTTEAFVSLSADMWNLAPTVSAYYDFDLESWTLEASASYTWEFDAKNSVETGASVGWVDEDGGTDYAYFMLSADYVYRFNDAASISVGGRIGANDDDRGIEGEEFTAWGGVAFTYGH